ncbi:MAG: putative nuclease with TOPRIM domain [Saprospiraceae bacterium]|jgi:predicted nuclease with TOPRIM domain
MAENNSKQRIIAIAAVIIIALLAGNAYLLFNKMNQDNQITAQASEIDEQEKLKAELEKQYYESLSELEEMKTNNEDLNKMIEEQQAELKDQKDRVSRLLRDSKNLKSARSEMANMQTQLDVSIAQVNDLKEQNAQLADANNQLAGERDQLQTDITTLGEEYQTTRATLVSEKEELSSKNANLSKTVVRASVINVQSVNVEGLKIKGSGKAKATDRADKVQQLKVCFNTTENAVTKPGKEQFYVRIINPTGETLAIEEMGSGIMSGSDSKEQIRYTKVKEYDYSNDETQLCFLWEPKVAFESGTYNVEVYNKGYISGASTFTLK